MAPGRRRRAIGLLPLDCRAATIADSEIGARPVAKAEAGIEARLRHHGFIGNPPGSLVMRSVWVIRSRAGEPSGASAPIQLIEGAGPYHRRVCEAMGSIQRPCPDAATVPGRVSGLECRVGPMKRTYAARLVAFDALFARLDIVRVELAVEIRVRPGLHAADALQAASCPPHGHEHVMLTRNAAVSRAGGLNTLMLA